MRFVKMFPHFSALFSTFSFSVFFLLEEGAVIVAILGTVIILNDICCFCLCSFAYPNGMWCVVVLLLYDNLLVVPVGKRSCSLMSTTGSHLVSCNQKHHNTSEILRLFV